MSALIVPLIVCGGSGTRLWPASRASRPKQFLPLFADRSTFQETVIRASSPGLFARPVVVTNHDHRFLVADQLLSIGVEADIVLEPQARDSGPAIAAGAAFIAARDGAQTLALALAADHRVRDVEGFEHACIQARTSALDGYIVTFGIRPAYPATGYGYIEPGDAIAPEIKAIRRFVEKPDADSAARYMAQGYLWNCGNFMFRADCLLAEYAKREPDTVEAVTEAVDGAERDLAFIRLDAAAFARAQKRSIDYAVMEKTDMAAVLPAQFDWSDVGSWDAVHDLSTQDGEGNALLGPGMCIDGHRNLIASEGQLVCLVGLDDLAVIATGDAVLVAPRKDEAAIKALVTRLSAGAHGRLTREHLQSYRPWGNYRSLDLGPRHQVKHIIVKPGGRLSLQKHHHRSEHWIVVNGVANVTVGRTVKTLHENESVYIPIGSVHRLENPGKIDLHLIEVQTGGYFGEDDIIRLDDAYNRPDKE